MTLGDPNQRTGGYRYHRIMAAAAPDHAAEVRFASIPPMRWPAPVLPARGVVRTAARASDAVLLDSIAAAFVAPWIADVDPPVIAVVHQPPGGMDHGWLRSRVQSAFDRRAYRTATGVVAASRSIVEDLVTAGAAPDRIRLVPPGCDVPVADAPPLDLRRGRGSAILCVANWSPRKGIVELVDAFATLPAGDATLWLVGSTDVDRRYAALVRRRIQAPDLRDRVVAIGAVSIEDVGQLYRSADVFALCSSVDPYGTAWAEAIAAGLPVVGWRAANLPSLAEDGREALMVEPGDARGLVSALRAITTDCALRERLASGARRRAAALPTWRRSTEMFFAAVRELLATAPTDARR